jgi:hypothetical protein
VEQPKLPSPPPSPRPDPRVGRTVQVNPLEDARAQIEAEAVPEPESQVRRLARLEAEEALGQEMALLVEQEAREAANRIEASRRQPALHMLASTCQACAARVAGVGMVGIAKAEAQHLLDSKPCRKWADGRPAPDGWVRSIPR